MNTSYKINDDILKDLNKIIELCKTDRLIDPSYFEIISTFSHFNREYSNNELQSELYTIILSEPDLFLNLETLDKYLDHDKFLLVYLLGQKWEFIIKNKRYGDLLSKEDKEWFMVLAKTIKDKFDEPYNETFVGEPVEITFTRKAEDHYEKLIIEANRSIAQILEDQEHVEYELPFDSDPLSRSRTIYKILNESKKFLDTVEKEIYDPDWEVILKNTEGKEFKYRGKDTVESSFFSDHLRYLMKEDRFWLLGKNRYDIPLIKKIDVDLPHNSFLSLNAETGMIEESLPNELHSIANSIYGGWYLIDELKKAIDQFTKIQIQSNNLENAKAVIKLSYTDSGVSIHIEDLEHDRFIDSLFTSILEMRSRIIYQIRLDQRTSKDLFLLVGVKYQNENGTHEKIYHYLSSDTSLQVGDIIEAPVQYGSATAVIDSITPLTEKEVEEYERSYGFKLKYL